MNRQLQLQLQQQQLLQQQLLLQQQQQLQEGERARPVVQVNTSNTTTITHSNAATLDNSTMVNQLVNSAPSTVLQQDTKVAAETAATALSPATTESSAVSMATEMVAADAQIAVLIDSSKSTAAAATPATPSTSAKRPSPEPIPAAKKFAKIETATVEQSPTSSPPTNSSNTNATLVNTTLSAATLQFLLQQQMQTPLVPQLFTGKLTREEIEVTLAKLLESTKHLLLVSQEAPNKDESPEAESEDEAEDAAEAEMEGEQPARQTHGLKTQPGIKTDDIPSSTDLKKMTSKERRQLRNKISARNFRVRRKEYIGQLEGQVEQHKTEARHLREAVTVVHEENKKLKEELEETRRQLAQSTISNASSTIAPQQSISTPATTLSNENQTLLSAILTRPQAFNASAKGNVTLTMPRPQSPSLLPNLNKDLPNSSSVSGSSWKDKNPVYVLRTLVPEISIGDQFQFDQKAPWSKDDDMWDRPWMNYERTPKELTKPERNPFLLSGVVYELMQTLASAPLNTPLMPEVGAAERNLIEEDAKATVQDYENDKRLEEALAWQMQQDLSAQVEATTLAASRKADLDLNQGAPQSLRTPSRSVLSSSLTGYAQEDPSMLEWLYESMMAQLVEMDVQSSSQNQQTSVSVSA
ncbi:hypothetical protein BGZ98_002309 [Dissophora globulifera]|nr:hypothetical protein BGZ98_002309 [Dissophora globulifera]